MCVYEYVCIFERYGEIKKDKERHTERTVKEKEHTVRKEMM